MLTDSGSLNTAKSPKPKDATLPPFIRIIRKMAARGFPTAISYTLSIQFWIIGLMIAYLSDLASNSNSVVTTYMHTTLSALFNETTQLLNPAEPTTQEISESVSSAATSPAASAIITVALSSITFAFFSFLYAENLKGSEIKGFIDLCTKLIKLYGELEASNQNSDKLLLDIQSLENNPKIWELFNNHSLQSFDTSGLPLLDPPIDQQIDSALADTALGSPEAALSTEEKIDRLRAAIGEHRRELAALNQAGIIAAIPLMPAPMLILGFLDRILLAGGIDPDVCNVVGSFMQYYIWAIPGIFTRIAAERMLFVLDRELWAMGIGLVSLAIGTLIAGILGLHTDLAERGVAIGFIVESYLIAAAYIAFACIDKVMKPYQFYNFLKLTKKRLNKYLKYIFRTGTPFAISFANEGSVSILLLVYACILGKTALAQLEFEQGVFLFVFLIAAATGHIHYLETSQLVGQKDYIGTTQQARFGLASTAIFAASATLAAATVLSIWSAYESNEDSTSLRVIFSFAVSVDAVRYLTLCGQRSMGDNVKSTVISAACLWAGMIAGGLTLLSDSRRIEYVAGSYLSGEILALAGLLTFRFRPMMNVNYLERHLTKKSGSRIHSILDSAKRAVTESPSETIELIIA